MTRNPSIHVYRRRSWKIPCSAKAAERIPSPTSLPRMEAAAGAGKRFGLARGATGCRFGEEKAESIRPNLLRQRFKVRIQGYGGAPVGNRDERRFVAPPAVGLG